MWLVACSLIRRNECSFFALLSVIFESVFDKVVVDLESALQVLSAQVVTAFVSDVLTFSL